MTTTGIHLDEIPSRLVERQTGLLVVDGETLVNRVTERDDVSVFRAGLTEFDHLVNTPSGIRKGMLEFTRNGYRVRTIGHRVGAYTIETCIFEPLSAEEIHDPNADVQLLFGAYRFITGHKRLVAPDHILEPTPERARPFLAMGRLATVA